jgi:hypothetical protein
VRERLISQWQLPSLDPAADATRGSRSRSSARRGRVLGARGAVIAVVASAVSEPTVRAFQASYADW